FGSPSDPGTPDRSNASDGGSVLKTAPVLMRAAQSWSFTRKKRVLPSPENAGVSPPVVETCLRGPSQGNDWTTTSLRPDSSVVYAIHRPSGENVASYSEDDVRKNGRGVLPASSDRTQMSSRVAGVVCVKASQRPSADQDVTFCSDV